MDECPAEDQDRLRAQIADPDRPRRPSSPSAACTDDLQTPLQADGTGATSGMPSGMRATRLMPIRPVR